MKLNSLHLQVYALCKQAQKGKIWKMCKDYLNWLKNSIKITTNKRVTLQCHEGIFKWGKIFVYVLDKKM